MLGVEGTGSSETQVLGWMGHRGAAMSWGWRPKDTPSPGVVPLVDDEGGAGPKAFLPVRAVVGLPTRVVALVPAEGHGLPKGFPTVRADMGTGPHVAFLAEEEG